MMKHFKRTSTILILFFAVMFVVCGFKTVNADMAENNLSAVDDYVKVGIDAKLYRGAVVLIAHHGKIAFNKAYGDAKKGVPMQKDSIFRWASMTKPVVMVGLMQLYDQGKFQLDDPLGKFLPEFDKIFDVAVDDGQGNIKLVPAKRKITMHDLMSYSAGFTCTFYYGMSPVVSYVTEAYVENGMRDLFLATYRHTLEDNVKAFAKSPLAHQPGEGWFYAHGSHDIIGYLIEKFSGMRLDNYMAERVFKPLKMNETWFYPPAAVFDRIPEATVPGNSDVLFKRKLLGLLPEDQQYTFGRNKTYFSAGGGLHGTVNDYYRFAQMMLNKGELDGVRVVSAKAVDLMTHPTPDKFQIGKSLSGNTWGYGLEVQLTDNHGGPGYWLGGKGSYGWRGIWSTIWNNNPVNDTVTIMMTQVGDDGAFPYMYLINNYSGSAFEN
jgi:CubicO group peptidase (beta-lactamase class C family)